MGLRSEDRTIVACLRHGMLDGRFIGSGDHIFDGPRSLMDYWTAF